MKPMHLPPPPELEERVVRGQRSRMPVSLRPKGYKPNRRFALLEVAFHNFDYVIGSFFGRFRIPGHVVADVILHEFRHEGVDGAARGSEALQYVRTMFIFVQAAKNTFELPNDLFCPVDQIQLFSRGVRHFNLTTL